MEDVILGAIERFEQSEEGSSFNRENCESDIEFSRMSVQWPEDIKKQRQEEGRPCLTINRLQPLVRQVVNEARQSKPGINVKPVDNGADVETAQVIGGLIKSIQRKGGDIAYDTAIDHAVSGGFGFFRIAIEYSHPDTFDLECRIERIPNPMMVHWDVSSTSFDASDWEYGFISDWMDKKDFKEKYKGAEPIDFEGDTREHAVNWIDEDKVRIAEYFLRTEAQRDLLEMVGVDPSTGGEIVQVIREDSLPGLAKAYAAAGGHDITGMRDDDIASLFVQMNGFEERRRRTVTYHDVVHRIISGVEVLEENPWPGSTIPICPVWGDEVYHNGERHFRSMIRDGRDPQQMFNFWRSATTELVALAPRAPWLIEEGAIPPGKEDMWKTANSRSWSYLPYVKGYNIPQRQPFASVPAGALQEAMTASDDIKSITGIFDSSIGAESNEKSGRAIMARERQSNVSNFHFIDNLNRAIEYAGRCLVEIIPSVYSPRQAVRILGDDDKEKIVRLTTQGGQGFQDGPDGGEPLYNLTVGNYDVDVVAGSSYASQREETREFMLQIMREIPGAAEFIGDIVMKYMDIEGADEIAQRLQMLMQAKGMAPGPQGAVPGQQGAIPGQPPGMVPPGMPPA